LKGFKAPVKFLYKFSTNLDKNLTTDF